MKIKDLSLKTRIMSGSTMPMVFVIGLGVACLWSVSSLLTSSDMVDHTHKVIAEAKAIQASMVDCETGMRGFMATGEEQFLEPYTAGEARIDGQIEELQRTVNDNPAQVARLDVIQQDVRGWLTDVAEANIEMRHEVKKGEAALAYFEEVSARTIGKEIFDEFRGVIGGVHTKFQLANDLEGEYIAAQILASMVDQETGQRGFLLTGQEASLDPYIGGQAALGKAVDELRVHLVANRSAGVAAGDADEIETLAAQWVQKAAQPEIEARRAMNEVTTTINDIVAAMTSGVGKKYMDGIRAELDEFASIEAGLMEERRKDAANTAGTTNIVIIGGATATILIALVLAYFVARGITRPIDKAVELTQRMNQEFAGFVQVVDSIANNDLTQEIVETEIEDIGINSKDEIGTLVRAIESTLDARGKIGNSLQTMTTNLTTMVRQMGDNSTQLVSAANEVASSSEQMSRGARDQTDQTTQVSTAVEEMTATIVESSKNAGEATEGARSAADTATAGGQIVNDTIQGMIKIAESAGGVGAIVGELASSADQIGEIITVIDDIADQTNLLALNAAIEAARAGEQGRGFAVVADEVRKLAERTGKATGEITGMIKGIQGGTGRAVESMEEAGKLVEEGKVLVDNAGTSLTEIVNLSQSVQDMIGQIATAAEEQSSAAEQISKNVENVSSIARESAKGAEQSATAAEELNRQAEGMQQMVARFKIKEEA